MEDVQQHLGQKKQKRMQENRGRPCLPAFFMTNAAIVHKKRSMWFSLNHCVVMDRNLSNYLKFS